MSNKVNDKIAENAKEMVEEKGIEVPTYPRDTILDYQLQAMEMISDSIKSITPTSFSEAFLETAKKHYE